MFHLLAVLLLLAVIFLMTGLRLFGVALYLIAGLIATLRLGRVDAFYKPLWMSSTGVGKILASVLLWPLFARYLDGPRLINPMDFLTGEAGVKELEELRKRAEQ